MAGSYNKMTVIGNLGGEPEMKYLPNGDPVTDFSVAVTERWKDRSGQQQERTNWFRISAFGQLAQTCKDYLHKGSSVYIEGPLTPREYTDRDGKARTSLDIRAREMRMLDRRGDNPEYGDSGSGGAADAGASPSYSRTPAAAASPVDDSDDIPF